MSLCSMSGFSAVDTTADLGEWQDIAKGLLGEVILPEKTRLIRVDVGRAVVRSATAVQAQEVRQRHWAAMRHRLAKRSPREKYGQPSPPIQIVLDACVFHSRPQFVRVLRF